MSLYNYDHFKSSLFDFTVFVGPGRGDQMPDAELQTLDGGTRRLSDYRGRTLVIETGSVTCPMYAKGVRDMSALASSNPEIAFVVLYVREAHPGERVGAHDNANDKRVAARSVEQRMGDSREILIDDIDGPVHRLLGGFPNMVYVVDPEGRVVFRGDWTDVNAVTSVLNGEADDKLLTTQHYPPAKPGPIVAIRTLLTGGLRAMVDFAVGLPGLVQMHRKADKHYAATETSSGSAP